jgi:hypothetical protein
MRVRFIQCVAAAGLCLLFGCVSVPPEIVKAYDSIDLSAIKSNAAAMQAAEINNDMLGTGTILLFRSVEGQYGKMLVTGNSRPGKQMTFQYSLYGADGAVLKAAGYASVDATFAYDFESNSEHGAPAANDFWWEWTEFNGGGKPGDPIIFVPQPGSKYMIYNMQ